MKRTVLTLIDHYLPGYNAGGPIRSVAGLVDSLGNEFDFKIVTRDRDLGSSKPYSEIVHDSWQRVGAAEVFYLSPRSVTLPSLRQLICATDHDCMYMNSAFSPKFTIVPLVLRRLRLIPTRNTIIAPRGEFSPGALRIRAAKKRAYIYLARSLGLFRGVVWQASSSHEMEDIRNILEDRSPSAASIAIAVAPDLTTLPQVSQLRVSDTKRPGFLRLVFLSRISPMKNIDGALAMLSGVRGEVALDIYGPVEDEAYWRKCQGVIARLPPNITVEYRGAIHHNEVSVALMQHDLFFLPSRGENYGHAIIEALAVGCPVLISDRTPWRDLERNGAGWDLPLDRPEAFGAVLQRCVDMGNDELRVLAQKARGYGVEKCTNKDIVQQNRSLFRLVSEKT